MTSREPDLLSFETVHVHQTLVFLKFQMVQDIIHVGVNTVHYA